MSYVKLREYDGKGLFEFKIEKPQKIEADFRIYFFSNAQTKIVTSLMFTKALMEIFKEFNEGQKFEVNLNGIITDVNDDIGTISIEKIALAKIEVSGKKGELLKCDLELICFSAIDILYSDETSGEVEIHYGLTNFIFTGCSCSVAGGNSVPDKIIFNVNNYNILLKKVSNYEENENILKEKKGCHITSEAIIESPIDEIDNVKSTILNVIELMSLATRNFISPIYHDYYLDGEIIRTVIEPVLTMDYEAGDNLIDTNNFNPCDLKIYLEDVYDKFQEFRDVLGLNSVILLYLISRRAIFTESKFLLTIVALESLSSHFEKYLEIKGEKIKPSLIGKTRKNILKIFTKYNIDVDDDVLEEIIDSVAYSNTTFNDKLIKLLRTFDVKYDSEDIDLLRLRNNIVHNGKFPEKINSRLIDSHEELVRLIYFLDRILLSILDYKDKPFLNIFNNYQVDKL